jgi:TolB-like protein/DNA-binding winged helix-turn-helix (wHTH) protein/Tfp pilus assembly protein PilF
MASLSEGNRVIRFGAFELDVQSGELRKQGLRTRLTPQSFQVLLLLLERRGEVVTREALRQKLWPADTFVDFDMGLSSAVKKLREALGDSAENPRFVETLPRRGYRFIAGAEPPAVSAPDKGETPGLATPGSGARRRWARSGAVAAAIVAAALIALEAGGGREWLARRFGTSAAPIQIKSIAVLPLENLSGDASQDYFVDGMTDALITELAQIGRLRVISRTSMMQYRATRKPLPEIARELNVEAVVEGTVVRGGARVRITAQLIHAPTDRHLWARSYDRELRDVLALQEEVARAIAQAVQVEVRPDERRRLSQAAAVDPEAYESYLKGRFYWRMRGRENLLKAAAYFQQAIAEDPTYAPAYSGLSDTYRQSDQEGLAPSECMPKAETAARKALALDDTLAEAHASLAGVLYRYHWDWDGAKREFQRSLDLDPNSAEGHRAYAIYLLTMRRDEEALPQVQRAQELSPLSPVISVEVAFALMRVGRYEEAIEQLRKTRALAPTSPRVDQTLALVYARQGDLLKAIAVYETARAREGRAAAAPGPWLGYLYGAAGRRAEALAALRALEERSRQQYVTPQHFATVHLGLGHEKAAFTFLERAYEQRAIEVLGFSGPLFDLLHDDPRYRDLIGRMGLAEAYFPERRTEAPVRAPKTTAAPTR